MILEKIQLLVIILPMMIFYYNRNELRLCNIVMMIFTYLIFFILSLSGFLCSEEKIKSANFVAVGILMTFFIVFLYIGIV